MQYLVRLGQTAILTALLLSAQAALAGPTTNISRILFGNDSEHAYAVAVDASGNSYVTGLTYSAYSFPAGTGDTVVHGRKDCALNGGGCPNSAFVVKIDTAGNIVAKMLFGGTGFTRPYAIAVDTYNVYIAGSTNSPTITTAAGRRANAMYQYGTSPKDTGTSRTFLAKFSPTLETLSTVTTLSASGGSEAHAMAVDSGGTTYLTGQTCGEGSPTTSVIRNNEAYTEPGCDAFVAHLDYFGSFSGYGPYYFARFGSYQPDTSNAIAVDANGVAWVAGRACTANFPVTAGLSRGSPDLTHCNAFVMKVDPSGSTYQYSMTFGGTRSLDSNGLGFREEATALTLNGTSGVYVGGFTEAVDFPTMSAAGHSPLQATSACVYPACTRTGFVAYLDAGLNLRTATYLGGSNNSQVLGLAKNSRGEVYVTGSIQSNSSGFPGTTSASFLNTGGYVAKLSGSLEALSWTNLFAGPVTSIIARGNFTSTSFWTAGDTYPNRTYTDAFMIKMTDAIASGGIGGVGGVGVGGVCTTCGVSP